MLRSVLIGMMVLAAPGAGRAEAKHAKAESAEYNRCIDAAGAVDFAMAECTRAEWQRQDAALNQAYRRLVAKLPPPRQTALRDAERAWVTFRDKQCDYEYSGEEGGTLAPVVYADCKLSMTEARLAELRELLSSEYP